MDVRLITRGELKLAGIKVVGRQQELSHRAPQAWLELSRRRSEIPHLLTPEQFYGVSPESDHLNNGQGGIYTYWVTTEVSAFGELPGELSYLTIPARTYAVATCKGDAAQIEPTYLGLSRWILDQGRKTDGHAYTLELYDPKRQLPTPPYSAFDYDIYKPLG